MFGRGRLDRGGAAGRWQRIADQLRKNAATYTMPPEQKKRLLAQREEARRKAAQYSSK